MPLVAIAMMPAVKTTEAALVATSLGDRGDGYNVVQITYDGNGANTGSWTVPSGITSVEVLVVGGGGAGGRGGAFGSAGGTGGSPGGGAGGLYYTTSWSVTPNSSITVAVGIGAPTTTATGNGADGGDSVFGSIIAYGGQGGQYTINQGGNQGGHSIDGGSNVTAGYLGGTGGGAVGGAGAGENGQVGGYRPSYGGAGVTVPITGSFGLIDANGDPMTSFGKIIGGVPQGYYDVVGYAGGGSAGYDGIDMGTTHGESYGGGSGTEPENNPGSPGLDTTGGGGGGGRGANGGAGGDGVIYVAYAIPEPGSILMLFSAAGLGLVRRRSSR